MSKHKKENYSSTLENVRRSNSEFTDKSTLPPKVKKAVNYINGNLYSYSLSVLEVNQECQITDKSFSTKFEMYIGFTPKEYIIHNRIRAGKLLLNEYDITVTKIALLLGYKSSSAFCNLFKRKTGCTPSTWREIHRNNK